MADSLPPVRARPRSQTPTRLPQRVLRREEAVYHRTAINHLGEALQHLERFRNIIIVDRATSAADIGLALRTVERRARQIYQDLRFEHVAVRAPSGAPLRGNETQRSNYGRMDQAALLCRTTTFNAEPHDSPRSMQSDAIRTRPILRHNPGAPEDSRLISYIPTHVLSEIHPAHRPRFSQDLTNVEAVPQNSV